MDIVHKVSVQASAVAIYEALSTQAGIQGWWAQDSDIAESTGQVSHMRFNKEGTIVEMQFRVDQLEAGQRVAWTCVANPNPAWIDTVLSFDIRPQGDGAAVTFIHGNWDAQWEGQPPYQMTKDTWPHFMQSLKSYCETGSGEPW